MFRLRKWVVGYDIAMTQTFKPTKAELLAAYGRSLPDLIAPGLKMLFCGINPGLHTAAVV